jgi:acylphosphatase
VDALRIIVAGRVQGVAFRAFTRREALSLPVRGWVRNRPDGTVEIQVAGEREALEALRAQVSLGPRFARVDRVEVQPLQEWSEPPPEDGFDIRF